MLMDASTFWMFCTCSIGGNPRNPCSIPKPAHLFYNKEMMPDFSPSSEGLFQPGQFAVERSKI